MEAKFFSEIEKKMDVKTLKDFGKDVRTQINNESETLRKKNDNLSRVLMLVNVRCGKRFEMRNILG